uniref:Macaca fascicularis brain cDNA clone: QflA-16534, similar to human KIAA0355 (KIAA0355), mRNA, RefSeq: NM_014686.2 n=1 Tax=Macaca fascicularis TaxID=9541 RepID=I7GL11_MACFA|nr:unnamed protein product [Macaca fascicularis]
MSWNQTSEGRNLPGSHIERHSFPFPSLPLSVSLNFLSFLIGTLIPAVPVQHSKPPSNLPYASKSSFLSVFPDTLLHTPEPHSVQSVSVYFQRLTACSTRLDQQPLRRHFKIWVPGSCLPSQPRESDA